MSTVSETLGGNAAPHVFTHAGKAYRPKLVTQDLKSGFERRMIDRALAAAGDNDRAVSVVMDRVASAKYSYHGKLAGETLATPMGIIDFASLVFGCAAAEMVTLLSERGPEVKALLKVILLESAPEKHRAAILAKLAEAEEAEGVAPNS